MSRSEWCSCAPAPGTCATQRAHDGQRRRSPPAGVRPMPGMGDADGAVDIYERQAEGTLRLISGGEIIDANAHYKGASADGTRVFFEMAEALPGTGDTDVGWDVYERHANGALRLISTSGSDDNARFAGASADGTRAFLRPRSPTQGSETPTPARTYTSGGRTASFGSYRRPGPAASQPSPESRRTGRASTSKRTRRCRAQATATPASTSTSTPGLTRRRPRQTTHRRRWTTRPLAPWTVPAPPSNPISQRWRRRCPRHAARGR